MALAATGAKPTQKNSVNSFTSSPMENSPLTETSSATTLMDSISPFKEPIYGGIRSTARRKANPSPIAIVTSPFALQSTIEETILHVVRALSKRHESRNLCLTGGVALNCVANARILRDTDYTSVWVPPCASRFGRASRQCLVALSSDAREATRLRTNTCLSRNWIQRSRNAEASARRPGLSALKRARTHAPSLS